MKKPLLLFVLVLISASLFSKDLYRNVNVDVYGGFGFKRIRGVEYEKSRGGIPFYGSIRLGYKIAKPLQIEAGITRNKYYATEVEERDDDIFYLSYYDAQYIDLIPFVVRVNPYKKLWFGVGAQYSFLTWAGYWPKYKGKETINITSDLCSNVWNAYFDMRLVYENVAVGVIYTQSVTPVHKINNDWKNTALSFYISVDISQLLKYYLF